ncbi:uncharacterized protein LAJ45_08377 [Morchella importuna]|uniref:uncharacterized protein n=1 Tax=Morchella importuna TaxID=1174673 RepID=UPI001E8D0508|nr:uncharacterized protein LAJ45_08377 [Morchella importuna]KAH8147550.1 hypothetical protein LAJ45_08377 [Morchella importuna]
MSTSQHEAPANNFYIKARVIHYFDERGPLADLEVGSALGTVDEASWIRCTTERISDWRDGEEVAARRLKAVLAQIRGA